MRQRGGSWEIRVYAGRDETTGKHRYISRTVRGGKREAETALANLVAEAGSGTLTHTTATVGELLERWFEHARGTSPRPRSARPGRSSTGAPSRRSGPSTSTGCR